MSYEWLAAPHEYEPDYEAYWRDLESLEYAMANVATYDDWFPDTLAAATSPIVAQQQGSDWIDDFESGNAAYAASFAR